MFRFCCIIFCLSCGVVWYAMIYIIITFLLYHLKISCRHLDTSLALSPNINIIIMVTIISLSYLELVSSFSSYFIGSFFYACLFCWFFIFLTSPRAPSLDLFSTVTYPELHHWPSSLLTYTVAHSINSKALNTIYMLMTPFSLSCPNLCTLDSYIQLLTYHLQLYI